MLLGWEQTKEILTKYQVPLAESLVIENNQQGTEFANKAGYPVVLKLISGNVLHKVDKGLVKLNIQTPQDLENTWNELISFQMKGAKIGSGGSEQGEVVIQKQVSGVELFLGMKRDKSFGPVVSFGLGGIFVEVLEDVVFGICPIDKKYALKIIESLKGFKILKGYRGQNAVDLELLGDLLVKVSKLAMENENIKEIDFNPVMAKGSDIFVVDPKILL